MTCVLCTKHIDDADETGTHMFGKCHKSCLDSFTEWKKTASPTVKIVVRDDLA